VFQSLTSVLLLVGADVLCGVLCMLYVTQCNSCPPVYTNVHSYYCCSSLCVRPQEIFL